MDATPQNDTRPESGGDETFSSAPASPESTLREPASHEHALRVRGLFSRIAGVYDLLNSVFSLGLDSFWRARLAAAAAPLPHGGTKRILDLAAGTMEVTRHLAGRYPEAAILAMDFCPPMLTRGLPKLARIREKRKARLSGDAAGAKIFGPILPLAGDGRRLPLADSCVDAITLAFGLRNIRPREEAYAEALRVLAPGGRLCVLEFAGARDRILFGVYNLYLHYALPLVGRLVSRDKGAYRYLAETIESFPSAAELEEEMRRGGFASVRHERYTFGIVCIHVATTSDDIKQL